MVIDISHHNAIDDWDAIKRAGICGIIHKATEGQTFVDATYAERRGNAENTGLLFGAYHFLRPGNMRGQAEHFLRTVANDAGELGDLLLAADHEDAGVSLEDLRLFMTTVDQLAERSCVLYSGHLLKEQLGNQADDFFSEHRLWLAHYGSSPTWPPAWSIFWLWQYSDGNHGPDPRGCPGCRGHVDTNSYQGTPEELAEQWSGRASVPEPAPELQRITITIEVPTGIKVVVNTYEG